MPRISFRDYMTPGARPWWEHVGDAGTAVAAGFLQHHKDKREDAEEARAGARKDRALAIEEQEAKAKLLAETNRATILGAKQAEHAAEVKGAVEGLQELAGQKREAAVRKGIDEAIRSTGGALGPFGLLRAQATGAYKGATAVEAEMAPKIELARTMGPAGARMYLEKEATAYKQEVRAEAFQKEAEAVLDGVADGVITPEMGQSMVEALQTALQSNGSPGMVHRQVAKAYDLHAKVQKRLAGWEEADRKAGELIAMLEKMAQQAEPSTTARQTLLDMVGKAKGEWGRTQVPSFREKSDGGASLAGLEAILFGAQAANEEMPSGIEYSEPPPPVPNREELIEGISNMGGGHRDLRGARAAAPAPAAGGPGKAQQPRAQTRVTPATRAKVTQSVDTHVFANGQAAVTPGQGQAEAIRKLRRELAEELGLEVTDPFLDGALTAALAALKRGDLEAPRALQKLGRPRGNVLQGEPLDLPSSRGLQPAGRESL